MIAATQLLVAGGDGLLVRRDGAVLFLPDPDGAESIVECFRGADAPAGAVGEVLVSNDLVGPTLALIEWGDAVSMMVFGDLQLETDHASTPTLSGASSTGWVERRIDLARGSADTNIWVAAPESTLTDLRSGVVPAGGFRLCLQVLAEASPAEQPMAVPPERETTSGDAPLTPPPQPPTDPPPASPSPPLDASTPAAIPQIEVAPPIDDLDHTSSLSAIQAAAVGAATAADDPEPPPPPKEPPPRPPQSEEMTIVPGGDDAATGRVEAKLCADGHANPPLAATCITCQALLPPAGEVVPVPQPVVGQLRVVDAGRVEQLSASLTIGRGSQVEGHLQVVGEKVSRVHAEVVVEGWEAFIVDRGSTNGTFLVPRPGASPVLLDPDQPQLLEFGAAVHIGDHSIVFERPGQ